MLEITRNEFLYLRKNNFLSSAVVVGRGNNSRGKSWLVSNDYLWLIEWLRKNFSRTNNYRNLTPNWMYEKEWVKRLVEKNRIAVKKRIEENIKKKLQEEVSDGNFSIDLDTKDYDLDIYENTKHKRLIKDERNDD